MRALLTFLITCIQFDFKFGFYYSRDYSSLFEIVQRGIFGGRTPHSPLPFFYSFLAFPTNSFSSKKNPCKSLSKTQVFEMWMEKVLSSLMPFHFVEIYFRKKEKKKGKACRDVTNISFLFLYFLYISFILSISTSRLQGILKAQKCYIDWYWHAEGIRWFGIK